MANPVKKALGRLLKWAWKKGKEELEQELDKQRGAAPDVERSAKPYDFGRSVGRDD